MKKTKFIRGALHLESVNLDHLAHGKGTPLYVYSLAAILENFHTVKEAFSPVGALICYAMKANSNGAILAALGREGAGLDIVSGGELQRGLAAGVPATRMVYAGVGKTEAEIELAIKSGILGFNIESVPEAELIAHVARRKNKIVRGALRINPDVDPHTHAHISTGKKETKFGIPFERAAQAFAQISRLKGLELDGLHMHIGSEILSPEPHLAALKRLRDLMSTLRRSGRKIRTLNLGGGFGIGYGDKEEPLDVGKLANRLIPVLQSMDCEIRLEPGRSIVGDAGLLLTRVLYIKKGNPKTFAIVDAGMNDLIRVSLYEAYHRIVRVREQKPGERTSAVDVVGPICETGDFFARDRRLPPLKAGDLLAVFDAGAYGMAMASHYNSHPLPAEILVRGNRSMVIRERETIEDLIRREHIPNAFR